jgi:hypothetical protein
MRASRREDRRKIDEIKNLRKRLAANRKLNLYNILFCQVKKTAGTAREHGQATDFPLESFSRKKRAENPLGMWTQLKRWFNITGDPTEKIIGVRHRFPGIDDKERVYVIEEIAYHKTAGDARQHQHKINKGGLKKEKDLAEIERDTTLKAKHDKKLRALLKEAGIN